jgi:FKBP-type peptidyl-prolyl cis-trans isomerase FkpA
MKQMKQMKFLLIAIVLVAAYSCFDDPVEQEPIDYTAAREAALLAEYIDTLEKRDYDVDTAAAGIYYVIAEPGEGAYVQTGDSIGLEYTGFIPENGYVFDKSANHYVNGLWKFRYNPGDGLIPGFEVALSLLQEGTEGLFIIPSGMAYGATGSGAITPYTTIAFQIKLVAIYE